MNETLICVGSIAGAYGVNGELRVKSFCAVPEDIEGYSPLTTEDGRREFALALIRPMNCSGVPGVCMDATQQTRHHNDITM